MQHGIQRNYFYFMIKRHFQKVFAQSPHNDKGNVENTMTGSHLGFQRIGETGHEQSQFWSAAMPLQARREPVSFWILADSCRFPRNFYFF